MKVLLIGWNVESLSFDWLFKRKGWGVSLFLPETVKRWENWEKLPETLPDAAWNTWIWPAAHLSVKSLDCLKTYKFTGRKLPFSNFFRPWSLFCQISDFWDLVPFWKNMDLFFPWMSSLTDKQTLTMILGIFVFWKSCENSRIVPWGRWQLHGIQKEKAWCEDVLRL